MTNQENKKVVLDIGERVGIENIRNMGQNQDLAKVVETKQCGGVGK